MTYIAVKSCHPFTRETVLVIDGTLQETPFATLNVDAGGERGLLGIALDPSFETNQWVYVYYTAAAPIGGKSHNRVSRFTASGNVKVPGSQKIILDLPDLIGHSRGFDGAQYSRCAGGQRCRAAR